MDTGSRRESVGELRWWLSRAVSAKEMSNASGVKHAATEPNQLDDKRERRRGTSTRAAGRAAGRAAALRRAPSDSDCSAETASLSADSGDRSVRPAIPPPRTTKSRSRRRGSEWEVLEGLKDGQRFEKRPEVFNGYLHKKRKWPLKGWHKRFFVVDGGILVYARSPTDVARGRLHGSVDVGLSVISAKARRRRIDIDADEFIYHLRAKTPDVFRTWLNVLKTHRLYRQHLLTFGARESVAKIHAPLDELGPTENSSRTTSFSSHIRQIPGFPVPYLVLPSPMGSSSNSCGSETLSCTSGDGSFETQIDQNMFRNRSLCSVECPKDRSMFVSLCSWSSETEKLKVDFSNQLSKHSDAASTNQKTHKSKNDVKNALKGKFKVNKNIQYLEGKMPADKDNSPTYFFFSRHKRCEDNTNQPLVRKSRKSTNVVKYKNKFDEPVLNKPLYDYTVLGKYKKKDSKAVYINVCNDSEKLRNNIHTRKTSQSPRCSNSLNLTMSDYDALVEKLMLSICKNGIRMKQFKTYNMKSYLNKIIDELYGMKLDSGYDNTVKELFRCLLEYWLKHTLTSFKNSTRSNKCTAKQSKELFMKDNTTSNIFVPQISMSTQIYVYGGDLEEKTPDVNAYHKNLQRKNNLSILNKKINSYVNEKRIQDIEEVMWNTVYVCETMRSDHSKEKDIKITRKLIDNLDGATDRSRNLNANNTIALMSDSSNEVSQIKETLDQLICDASIPSCVAQDFLRLYLNLLHDKSASESTSITGESDSNNGQVQCDVQTESVVKKMSISVSTKELSNKMDDESKKDSQVYIQPVLDKISGLFAINCNNTYNIARKYCDKGPSNYSNVNNNNVELHTNKISSQVDLSKTCLINTIRNKNLNYLDDTVTRSFEKSNYIDGIDLKPYESCGNMKLDSDIASECIKPDVNIPTHRKLDVIDREIVNPEYRPSARLITKDDDDMQPCYMMSLGENNVTKKLKQNNITDTKNKCKTPHPVNPLRSVNFNEEISIFDNPPKIVDEKSILLLVEQLATLSRSVPTIHKDINSLFIKLRKKYEKNLSGKMHGLSLLGKIYSDEPKTRDKESQYPTDIICNLTLDRTTSTHTDIYNKSIGTNDCQTKYTNKSNKFGDTDIETNLGSKSLCVDAANNITHMTITTQTSSIGNVTSVELSKSDKAISNQNWHEYDQGISSVVQYVLNASPRKSYVILEEGENRRLKQRYCPKTKENLMEEISKLREFKVSTQSQTEDRLRCLHSKPANTDYKVYQLFLCHKYATKKSNSAVNLGDKLKSDDDLWTIYKCSSDSYISGLVSPTSPPIRGPQAGFVSGTPGGRLASWIIESGGPLDNASRELGQAQLSVQQLQRLLDALELQQQAHHDTDVSLEGASPNVKKDRRKFGLRKKKSSNKCASVELAPPQIDASNSHTAISALTAPPSPGGGASSVPNSAASLPIVEVLRE